MLTIEQIRERLKDMNLTKVAKACDLNTLTVRKMLNYNGSVDLCYSGVKRVSDYLEAREK